MRITSWNARGLNNPSKKRLIKQYLNKFSSNIIIIQETKLILDEGSKLARSLGIQQSTFIEARGASGGLGILWNPKKVVVLYLEHSYNWMCVNVQSLKSDLKFILVNIYGLVCQIGKKIVWDEVSSLFSKYKDNIIALGGDFNTIISLDEKRGGIQHLSRSSLDFKGWIDK